MSRFKLYNKMAQSLPLRTAPTIVYFMPPKFKLGGLFLLPQTPLREKVNSYKIDLVLISCKKLMELITMYLFCL